MHINPYLIIEGEKYLVDDFKFGFRQKPNAAGVPVEVPVFEGLHVVIRGHYPGFFLGRWACASNQSKLVELVLKPLVFGSGPTRVFTFFDAHLVDFTKNYSEKKNPPVEMILKITAGGVRDSFSKSEYSSGWRETFEKPCTVVAQSTTEEACVDSGEDAAAGQEEQVSGDEGKLKSILDEMKNLVDKHIPYSQLGERNSLSAKGLKALDCSETVAIYLHKLGVMPNYHAIYTGLMTNQKDFRKAVGSSKIEFVEGSDKADFTPNPGDIFVWRDKNRKPRPDGHTGIVYEYNSLTDVVIILEAIARGGAVGESKQIKNGGYKKTGCSRTAMFDRLGGALHGHRGWIGYFRPINY